MASDQVNGCRLADGNHPTRSRRRLTTGPPAAVLPPHLPEIIARHRIDTSSEDVAEECDLEHDAKKQRSTSNTPRSSLRELGRTMKTIDVMGMGPVGSSSDQENNSELTD